MAKTTRRRKVWTPKYEDPKPWIPSEGIAMLRMIQRQIRQHPSSYRQDDWHCGTAMCVAGHAAMLAGLVTKTRIQRIGGEKVVQPVVKPMLAAVVNRLCADAKEAPRCEVFDTSGPAWAALGAVALGIGVRSADRLFSHPSYWPPEYAAAYNQARTRRAKAKAACARIDYFIQTGA